MKVLLIKIPDGGWSILKEDGKLATKHEFDHSVPTIEIKKWCESKNLEIHGVLCPDWTKPIVEV